MLQYAIDKIQSCDDLETAKSIANSVNKNQVRNKKWLVKHLQPYLDMYTDPKIVVAAGWHGLAAHMIDRDVVSFDMVILFWSLVIETDLLSTVVEIVFGVSGLIVIATI